MKPDPTRTKVLRQNFVKQIRILINNFGKKAIPRLTVSIKENKPRLENSKTHHTRQKIMNSAVTEINRILDEVEYEEIHSKLRPVLRRYARNAYENGAKRGVTELNKQGIEAQYTFSPADVDAVFLLIDNDYALMKNATAFMKKEITRVISTGMLEGQSITKMSQDIRDRINVTKPRADAIARTETIRAYNSAAMNKYKQNGIKKWMWLTARDERVRAEHEELDGQIFNVGDPQPPLGVNCRCTVIPHVEK